MVRDKAKRDLDFPFKGELEGVRHEVEDDLLPHLAVDAGGLGERRAIDLEREPGALAGRAEVARELGGEGGEIGVLVRGLRASGLDAREIEQRVDKLEEPLAVSLRDLEERP